MRNPASRPRCYANRPVHALTLLSMGLMCLAFSSVPAQEPAPDRAIQLRPRPNIVLFIVDDLGWQDTSVAFGSAPTEAQVHFRTPLVVQLATHGVCFSQAYACAVCSPTRVSIMTGMNAARHGVTNWILDPQRETSGVTPRLAAPRDWQATGITDAATTLPNLLSSIGYTTIHCGKAHWGAVGNPLADPLNIGFAINIAGHAAGAPGSYQCADHYGNNLDGTPKPPWGVPGLERFYGTQTHLTDALALEACEAIRTADRSKPLFLYMAPYAVHTPIQPHHPYVDSYRGGTYAGTEIKIPDVEADYASMVAGVDAALGQILRTLDDCGMAEQTLVIFTSDNGGLSAHTRQTTPRNTGRDTHNYPLREGKGSAYEGGIRVPLVVSWAKPDSSSEFQRWLPIPAGSRSSEPVISEDLFATVLTWAGVATRDAGETEMPSGVNSPTPESESASSPRPVPCDGRDISEAILGRQLVEPRSLVFHYPHVWGPPGAGYQPHSGILQADWKAIYFYQPQRWELYHLADDIGQERDLSIQEPQKLLELSKDLLADLRAKHATFPALRDGGGDETPRPPAAAAPLLPVASPEIRSAAAGWMQGQTWADQHRDIMALSQLGSFDLALIGDSITQSWGGVGRQVQAVPGELVREIFGDRQIANLGISGDRTQHVLWRIEHGELQQLQTPWIVILIGTNNLNDDDPREIADGIELIVRRVEEKLPRATILLHGILPRGATDSAPLRVKLRSVNRLVSQLANSRSCYFVDLYDRFVQADGDLKSELYSADQLHLNEGGYRVWGGAVQEAIESISKTRSDVPRK